MFGQVRVILLTNTTVVNDQPKAQTSKAEHRDGLQTLSSQRNNGLSRIDPGGADSALYTSISESISEHITVVWMMNT